MKPTDEQWEELLKWCGWEYKLSTYEEHGTSGISVWMPPEGYDGVLHLSPPEIDLNNLFKYPVTQLQDKGYVVRTVSYEHKGHTATIESILDGSIYQSDLEDELEDALFWAIYPLIKQP